MRNNGECRVGEKFLKASHGVWYCHIYHADGRDQLKRLDADKEEAEKIRQALIDEIAKGGRPSMDCTVDHLIQLFLAHVEANNAKDTLKWYKNFLKSFGEFVGMTLLVRDVKLSHVQNWLSKHYPQKGNQNTRHNSIACVKRLFNWATKDMEYFDRNPLAALKKPRRTHREVCPTRAQWEQVVAHYTDPNDPFRLFLEVLLATGCRPQELRCAEARQIDLAAGVIHFADGEIRGKQYGRDVILSERAIAILKPLVLAHPEGPVFRNEDGNPWTKNALNCRFQRLKAKFPFRLNCYAARHSKATDLLENGASAGAVASILGHRDPTVVLRFYGKHIDQRTEHLRGLVEKADPPLKLPPKPPKPEKAKKKGGKKAKPEPKQDDDNPPQGLKVIGQPKPKRKSNRRKRNAE